MKLQPTKNICILQKNLIHAIFFSHQKKCVVVIRLYLLLYILYVLFTILLFVCFYQNINVTSGFSS